MAITQHGISEAQTSAWKRAASGVDDCNGGCFSGSNTQALKFSPLIPSEFYICPVC